jgi:tRNA A-37 threonylcarbamoyl transferase component Bud32
MIPDSSAEDDPLDPGLRAAFAPVGVLSAGESVFEYLRATCGIREGVLLREDPSDVAERSNPTPGVAGMTGRYQVAGELARGGIGVVLKGRDVDLGRDVALKVLRAEHAGNPSLARRLIEEAQIGGQLQHPGILPIYELGLDRSRRPFFAMKLVRGVTLADMLRERKSPGVDQIRYLGIFEQLCHAMAYSHARGVIHRDLKPSNVMVGSFGEVQVVDWGLAKVLSRGGSGDETRDLRAPEESSDSAVRPDGVPSHSEAGSVLGTPAYMPPEQARGEIGHLDERSDVFGLGAILCEILTGHPPYGGTRHEILEQARAGRIASAIERLNQCSAAEELIALARRCLAPERDDRPRDAGEVVRTVRTHREAVDARARAAELRAARAKARLAAERRGRRLVAALASVVLLASAIAGGFYLRSEHQKLMAAEARQRADRAALDLERERRARLEATLEILVPLEGKARYMLLQAAEAADRDLDRWVTLLGLVRQVVLRSAENAPTEATRRKAGDLADELRKREGELRARLAKAGSPPRPSPAPEP